LAEGNVTVVNRLNGAKVSVSAEGTVALVTEILRSTQEALLLQARVRLNDRTVEVKTLEDAVEAAQTGFAVIPGALADDAGETQLNSKSVSVRCLRRPDGSLPEPTDNPNDLVAVVARAY